MASGSEPRPTLSVLVLNYNYGRFLGECLASILVQTFRDYELIVLDDCSTDGSLDVAHKYAEDSRVRIVAHEANRGFVASLIEGTEELSRGEFLMVISADDLVLEADAFGAQVARLQDGEGAGACLSAYIKLGPGSARSLRRLWEADRTATGLEFVRCQLTDGEFTVLQSGTMIRAAAYRRAGGYRRDLSNYLDLAMWLALGRTCSVAYVHRALYGYRVHESQFSGSRARHRQVLREGIDLLVSEAVLAQQLGLRVATRRVLRTRVADLALADAFAGRRARALQRCIDAVALAPGAALTSKGWWIAFARALSGTRAWSALAFVRNHVAR